MIGDNMYFVAHDGGSRLGFIELPYEVAREIQEIYRKRDEYEKKRGSIAPDAVSSEESNYVKSQYAMLMQEFANLIDSLARVQELFVTADGLKFGDMITKEQMDELVRTAPQVEEVKVLKR